MRIRRSLNLWVRLPLFALGCRKKIENSSSNRKQNVNARSVRRLKEPRLRLKSGERMR
jgi:hypothetical protein